MMAQRLAIWRVVTVLIVMTYCDFI